MFYWINLLNSHLDCIRFDSTVSRLSSFVTAAYLIIMAVRNFKLASQCV